MRGTWVTLAAAFAALAIAPAAHGAVTVGSDLSATTFESKTCMGICTGAYNTDPQLGHPPTSPINGVIVRWRLNQGANASADNFSLRVLRPADVPPAVEWTGVRTAPPDLVPAAAGLYVFAARLPISAGQGIGIDFPSTHGVILSEERFSAVDPFTRVNYWYDGLANGATEGPDQQYAHQLLINADVEPDADGDGFGDETQDPCPTSAASQTAGCGAATLNPKPFIRPPCGAIGPKRRKKGKRSVLAAKKKKKKGCARPKKRKKKK